MKAPLKVSLDEILNNCLDRLLAQKASLAECLAAYPEQRAALEPLLQVATLTAAAVPQDPSPAFVSATRSRLLTALAQKRAARQRPRLILRPLALRLAAALVALLLVLTSCLVVSADSLPDSPLYPVKLAAEQVQIWLAPDAEARAQLHLQFVQRRFQEAQDLLQQGKSLQQPVLQTLNNEAEQARAEINQLRAEQAQLLRQRYADLLAAQRAALTQLQASAPAEMQANLGETIGILDQVQQQVRQDILAGGPPTPTPSNPAIPPSPSATTGQPSPPTNPPTEPAKPTVPATPVPVSPTVPRPAPPENTPTPTPTPVPLTVLPTATPLPVVTPTQPGSPLPTPHRVPGQTPTRPSTPTAVPPSPRPPTPTMTPTPPSSPLPSPTPLSGNQ